METYALTHLTLLTGDREGTVLEDRTVVVEGEKIAKVVESSQTPAGITTIDLSGHYAMPGLINAHCHFFSEGRPLPALYTKPAAEKAVAWFFGTPAGHAMLLKKARQNILTQLYSGVTTVRSLGEPGYEVCQVRDEIYAGKITGPTVLASGPLLAATGGHGAPQIALTADDPWSARANARRNIAKGVDVIKIAATGGVTDARTIGEAGRAQLTTEEMAAICEEAHNSGKVVAAHAQGQIGVLAAVKAGVDTIEHGCELTPEIVELMLDNPKALHGYTSLVPTLTAAIPFIAIDPAKTGATNITITNGRAVTHGMITGLKQALEHDIHLGIGNDSAMTYVPQYDYWRELDAWTIYSDITPAHVLNVATQGNAEMLGLKSKGHVEEGYDADLVIVENNPLDDFRALADPRMVVARGTRIDHPTVKRFPEIDAELDSIRGAEL